VFAEDIDRSRQELTSSGADIVEPLERKPRGLRQFTVKDLDGNLFYSHKQEPEQFKQRSNQEPVP
jgi:uncharacterized glyoxalase superfamily protein PhnB